MSTPSVVSKFHPLNQYKWGKNCEAWDLVDNSELSVKLEKMPPGAEEALHHHKAAQQFFYVTKGKAFFEVDDVILIVHAEEGLYIEPGRKHRIMNKGDFDLEFIVFSQPSANNDRYNLV
jgi:mannose-6-phosphate isomerase-like protein (cupin superfamily)